MEVICAILVALFGIGFGIFMALQPPCVPVGGIRRCPNLRRSTSG